MEELFYTEASRGETKSLHGCLEYFRDGTEKLNLMSEY